MGMDVDASFAKDEDFVTLVEAEVDEVARTIAAAYLKEARAKTPIDRDGDHPGRLRSGWKVAVKPEGAHGRVVVLSNSVDYLPYVEYGHRLVRNGKAIGYVKGKRFVKRARKKATGKPLGRAYGKMYKNLEGRMS